MVRAGLLGQWFHYQQHGASTGVCGVVSSHRGLDRFIDCSVGREGMNSFGRNCSCSYDHQRYKLVEAFSTVSLKLFVRKSYVGNVVKQVLVPKKMTESF